MALRGVKGQGPFPSETLGPQAKSPRAFRESTGFEKQLAQPQEIRTLSHLNHPQKSRTAPPKG